MKRKHNPALTPCARALRKNMTPQERKLWYEFLRDYPVRILRQRVIRSFIVDFYCARVKLVIELDGSQHYSEEGAGEDADRTAVLQEYGLRVIRFSNREVERNFPGVCAAIDEEIQGLLRERAE